MSQYGLIRPFDIDDGQLEGLAPHEIFVLGYELAQVDAAIEKTSGTTMLVHAENLDRIKAQLKRKDRHHIASFMPDDSSETWVQLHIAQIGGGV